MKHHPFHAKILISGDPCRSLRPFWKKACIIYVSIAAHILSTRCLCRGNIVDWRTSRQSLLPVVATPLVHGSQEHYGYTTVSCSVIDTRSLYVINKVTPTQLGLGFNMYGASRSSNFELSSVCSVFNTGPLSPEIFLETWYLASSQRQFSLTNADD